MKNSNRAGLEVNVEKTKYIFTSRFRMRSESYVCVCVCVCVYVCMYVSKLTSPSKM